jgi:predicted membrane channel-forming protein YqfA (hemolysin III family)
VPDWLVRVVALFNPVARAVVGELGSVRNQDASHAKAVLGWATRPVEQSIVDLLDNRLRFAHLAFHLFVMAGSGCHVVAAMTQFDR